jgi:aspartate racemase
MQNQKLGILALGANATNFYLKKLAKDLSFELLKTNFEQINNLLPKPSKQLENIMKNYIEQLLSLEVNKILIPNITLHETIDNIKIDKNTNIIHPIALSIKAIKANNFKQVVLLGSLYTMHSNYIKDIFGANNIKLLLPKARDMQLIDTIRKQVYENKASIIELNNFNNLVEEYAKNNAVIIACTELSIALNYHNKNVFDMALLQIQNI